MTGSLYIVAAPSGAGKTSLVNALIKKTLDIQVSVSHTTRKPRPGEVDGQHYHFVSEREFLDLRASGAFLESAKVFDHYYGTSKAHINENLVRGTDVLLEIDWQGARQVREAMNEVVSVFILPPSREALQARLEARGQDDETVIARRMRDAIEEMSHYDEFDYLIFNDDFDDALNSLSAIFAARRLRRGPQVTKHKEALNALLNT